ncbi:nitroreductase family protein [Nocardioides marmorisolisilvae]|uniref:Nitroreductase n=1 Tax=Nocardioides marmorisolisilvae TaxID=1542737 RepID=A0A3N0DI09_9ACTN|nr:nitroreductase family protein [Nocardioides marmorisolisilvae]RNL75322.1 nitroreductase [Nocardioides marmorisolisilvae]
MPTSTEPQIHPLLRERWSSRSFDPTHELDEGELEQLLEAARWAPSAGNSQPWAFLALKRGEQPHARFVQTLSRGNTPWVPNASVVLVSLFKAGDDEDPSFTYSDYAEYDLGQSVAHLTVQASALGLGVHQFAGFDHDAVAREFGVPANWKVTTGIAVGRYVGPDEASVDAKWDGRERVRNPLSTFVFSERFGEPRWS